MSDHKEINDAEILMPGPGALLRAEREKQNITVKEIASQLNLHTEVVDALELDDNEKLPAPMYVRGYIRSYARILKLDADKLIGLYDQDASGPPEIIPEIKQTSQASSTDKPVKAATSLVAFCLLLLFLSWWLQSNKVVKHPVEINPEVSVPVLEAPPEKKYVPVYPEEIFRQQHGLTAPSDTVNQNEPDQTTASDKLPDFEPESPGQSQSQNTGTGPDQVNLHLIKDSWVEVKDTNDTKLYLGLARAGSNINLSGTAPFDVLLGYSPGVEITFNGTRFDPEPFSNNGIARFVLETEEPVE